MTKLSIKSRLRGQDFINLEELEAVPVTIIGAGSIGSFTALGLTKMGISNLTVVDFDTVDEVNIGCQLYGPDNLGEHKVIALADILSKLTGVDITLGLVKWTPEMVSPVLVSAVDSMDVRREIWEGIKFNSDVNYYIDGRMAGEYLHIFTVNMADKEARAWYEKSLTPRPVEELSCSAKGIVYNTLIIGGLITNQVKRVIKKEVYSREIILDIPTLGLVK